MGSTMGKVLVAAKVENLADLFEFEQGRLANEQVRRIEVPDALVDTGATTLILPKRMITALGLQPPRTRQARGIGGTVDMTMYRAVRLTVQGRDCVVDVGEIPDDLPVLIGQVPSSCSIGSSIRNNSG